METPHDAHRPDDLSLWFADTPEPAEVERCDDAACPACASAEVRPIERAPDTAPARRAA